MSRKRARRAAKKSFLVSEVLRSLVEGVKSGNSPTQIVYQRLRCDEDWSTLVSAGLLGVLQSIDLHLSEESPSEKTIEEAVVRRYTQTEGVVDVG